MPIRIGLVTCANVGEGAQDDAPYQKALGDLGAEVDQPLWTDAQVDWASYDAVQVRTTWDYHSQRRAFVAWAQSTEALTRLHNPAALLEWNTDKIYMRELALAGVPIVPSAWISAAVKTRAEFRDIASQLASERLFLKPTVGANADGTLRFPTDDAGIDQALAHLDSWLPRSAMMLQPYLPSVEGFGELSLIYVDGVPSHGVRKVPKPGDFRVQDDHGASDFPHPLTPELREFGQRVIAAIPARFGRPPLYARVDIMTGPQGELWLGELELVEPSIFFRHDESAAARMAGALLARLA